MSEEGGEIIEEAGEAGLFDALKAFFRRALRLGGDDAGEDLGKDALEDEAKELPTLPPRPEMLAEDREMGVRYLDESELPEYQKFVRDGKIYNADGTPFDTSDAVSPNGRTGRAIFVMDEDGNLYASNYQERGVFQHTTFLGGGEAAGAGEITVDQGELKMLSDQSGRYSLPRSYTKQVISQLGSQGIDIDPGTQVEWHSGPDLEELLGG
jgi:hypothetical protein